ncbi:MAG: alpha/beta fold hydrolase [Polyangiaceae bacterium]|nr:alpha/beta fold hydrolase [Polyangiaceae bacterium]
MRRAPVLLGVLMLNAMGCGARDDHPPPASESRPSEPAGDEAVPTERLPSTTAAYRTTPCWFETPAEVAVECGRVKVPEDPARPDGTAISLAVARFFSDEMQVAEDPVVYLEGGPGGAATSTVSGAFAGFQHLLRTRDLIVVDQRGTGRSQPLLDCPELDSVTVAVGSEGTGYLDALSACRDRLVREGVDLDTYTSVSNATDLDAVRIALGYARWNLYGISYGSRLGLTILRDHPAGVRSAALDGILPLEIEIFATAAPTAQRSFEAVFALCNAEEDCAAAYPDPMTELEGVFDGLQIDPAVISLGYGSDVAVTGDMALNLLFLLLYDSEAIPYLPALVHAIATGNYTIFESMLSSLSEESLVAIGMYLSVVCAEDAPFSSPEAVRAEASRLRPMFQRFAEPLIFEECERWSVAPAPTAEDEPVASDIPTLLTSGSLDPVTPPSNGDLVEGALLAAAHVVLPYASHGASITPCGAALVDRFLDAPRDPIDRRCVDAIEPLEFEIARARPLAQAPRFHTGPIDEVTLDDIADRARIHRDRLPGLRIR